MDALSRHPQTLTTSYLDAQQTAAAAALVANGFDWAVSDGLSSSKHQDTYVWGQDPSVRAAELGSTGKGILIGMLSAFGSAAFVAIILAVVYFFRYTSKGQIFLDSIGRPGEYDDEQAFLREEEQALDEMDDFQRAEYLRAKGALPLSSFRRMPDIMC